MSTCFFVDIPPPPFLKLFWGIRETTLYKSVGLEKLAALCVWQWQTRCLPSNKRSSQLKWVELHVIRTWKKMKLEKHSKKNEGKQANL